MLTLALFRGMDVSVNLDKKMSDLSNRRRDAVGGNRRQGRNLTIPASSSCIELTSAITGREVAKLFEIIRGLKAKGIAIIYISHKMDEIFRISDTITVLRDGQYIETRPAKDLDHDTLVKLMVGRKISELFPKINSAKGAVAFEAEGLMKEGLFEDISFKVRKGEVFGIAGLMGAGRTDVMETVFGLRRANTPAASKSAIGRAVRIQSPAHAILRHRMALNYRRPQKTKGD